MVYVTLAIGALFGATGASNETVRLDSIGQVQGDCGREADSRQDSEDDFGELHISDLGL